HRDGRRTRHNVWTLRAQSEISGRDRKAARRAHGYLSGDGDDCEGQWSYWTARSRPDCGDVSGGSESGSARNNLADDGCNGEGFFLVARAGTGEGTRDSGELSE